MNILIETQATQVPFHFISLYVQYFKIFESFPQVPRTVT